jgi:hypothetical protein
LLSSQCTNALQTGKPSNPSYMEESLAVIKFWEQQNTANHHLHRCAGDRSSDCWAHARIDIDLCYWQILSMEQSIQRSWQLLLLKQYILLVNCALLVIFAIVRQLLMTDRGVCIGLARI